MQVSTAVQLFIVLAVLFYSWRWVAGGRRLETAEEITFKSDTATDVQVFCSANGWAPAPMERRGDTFSHPVPAHPEGEQIQYKLLVDGEWVLDRTAPMTLNEGWNANNVIG